MIYRVDWMDAEMDLQFDKEENKKLETLLYYARRGMEIALSPLDDEKRAVLHLIDNMQRAVAYQKRVTISIKEEEKER